MKRLLGRVCRSSAAPKKKAFERGGPIWPPLSNAKDDRTAPKKKAFDRGGPVWPPRSNAADDRLRGSGEALLPQPKTEGLGGAAPQPKPFFENEKPKKQNL